MGEHKIIEFDKKDDLKAKYASALKALSMLGIKMKTKEPQPAKLADDTSKKKPAGFWLTGDTKYAQLIVKQNKKVVEVLGTLDIQTEDKIEQLKTYEKIFNVSYKTQIDALKAASQADARAVKASATTAKADPRAIKQADAHIAAAVEVKDRLTTRRQAAKTLTLAAVLGDPAYAGVFEAYARKARFFNEVEFIQVIDKGGSAAGRDQLWATYVDPVNSAKDPVNLDNPEKFRSGEMSIKAARDVVARMVEMDQVPKFRLLVGAQIDKQLEQADKALKVAREARAKLGK